jgi:tetratricopeptide (TPR) repeat protein
VFAIQENIAENVATALRGVLTSKEKEAIRRPETNIEAYEYFLKGRELFHRLALKEARTLFEKAIEIDPSYALAYAGLADAHAWLYEWEGADKTDLEAAEKNSQKALALAPNLSESHASRGFVLALDKRYDEAEEEFKKAIKLNANNFDAYYYYARSCFARGQMKESAELFLKASEIRREDFQSLLLRAQSLHVLGEPSQDAIFEGIKRARKQLQLDPTNKRALSLTPGSMYEIGEKEEAFQWINKALDLYPEDTGVLINAACLFARDLNKEKALDLLEKVLGKGFGKKDWIEHDPDFDDLRDEPRFKALLDKLQ